MRVQVRRVGIDLNPSLAFLFVCYSCMVRFTSCSSSPHTQNLYGPDPSIWEAIRSAPMHIYPDPESTQLRTALAAYLGVAMNQVWRLFGMAATDSQ